MLFICFLLLSSSAFVIQCGDQVKSYDQYSKFLQAFSAINISKNPQNYIITLDKNINLSNKDFPIDIPMIHEDHMSYFLYIQATDPKIVLSLDISSKTTDRFQYVAFQNISISFIGNNIDAQNIIFGENCTLKSKEPIDMNLVDITLDWLHINIFNSIQFVRIYLTYNNKEYQPENFPKFEQKLHWYEGNSIRLNLFSDSIVSFSNNQLVCKFNEKQFIISIPTYNYTVSFAFILEQSVAFTISGDYKYSSEYPHYLFILPSKECQVILNKGNYMTSKFAYYQDSGMLTVNNELLFKYLTIDGNAKLNPISKITVKYFDYFSEEPIQDNLDLSCRIFRATPISPFHCIDKKTLSIKAMHLTASDPLIISGSVTVNTSLSLFLPYQLIVDSLNFENTPNITFEGDFSDNCTEINAPIHSNGDIKGKANFMISKTMSSFPDQHEGQFYPFLSSNGKVEISQFKLIYDSDETEYGFTKETSYLQLKKINKSVGIEQTKTYYSPFISLCYGDNTLCENEPHVTYLADISDLSNYINEFTSGIDLIIYKSCDLNFVKQINRTINLLIDVRSSKESNTIAKINIKPEFAKHIQQLTLEINGEMIIMNPISINGSIFINLYEGTLKSIENLNFTSSTKLILNSLTMLNNFTNWSQCKCVHIHHENITEFTFIDNGWRITSGDDVYEIKNIDGKNIIFQPSQYSSNIQFNCITNNPQFINIVIGEGNSYILNDIPHGFLPFYISSDADISINNKYLPIDFQIKNIIPSNSKDIALTINSLDKSINNIFVKSPVDIVCNLIIKSTSIKVITFEDVVSIWNNINFNSITPTFKHPVELNNEKINIDFIVNKLQLIGNTSLRMINKNVSAPCTINANVNLQNDGVLYVPQIYSADDEDQLNINIVFDHSHINEKLSSLSTSLGYKSIEQFINHLKGQKFILYLTSKPADKALSTIHNDDKKDIILFQDKVIHFQYQLNPAVNSINKEYDTFVDFGNVKKSNLQGYQSVYLSVSDITDRYSTVKKSKSSGSSNDNEIVDNYPISSLGNFPINVAYLGASQLVNFSLPYTTMKKVRKLFGHIMPSPNFQHTAIWIGESDESDDCLGATIVYGKYQMKDSSYLSRDGAKAFVTSLKEFKEAFTAFNVKKLKVSNSINSKVFMEKIIKSGFWRANTYNWAINNCQHFTAKCISILNAKRINPSGDDWTEISADVLRSIIKNEKNN